MKNHDVAELLERLSLLSEAAGEERFKAIAYRRASTSVKNLGQDIEETWRRGELEQIPYVGEGIAKKIDEYLRTGKLEFLERLEKKVPEGAVELMRVQGVGPRTAYKLAKDYGVKTVEQLKEGLASGGLNKAVGEVMAKRLLESIEKMKSDQDRMLLVEALYLSKDLEGYFQSNGVEVEMAGSLRRRKETIGDLDVLTSDERATKLISDYPGVGRVIVSGDTKTSVLLKNGVQVDVRVIARENYGAALLYFTGSKEHNIILRDLALKRHWRLNEYELAESSTGKKVAAKTETEVYNALGLSFIPPELREARGEIEAAREGKLPHLIDPGDIRGDLQMHTTWSDGADELEAMATAAHARGYEYIAITDHSVSVGVANGLSVERFGRQWKAIDELNDRLKPFRILKGVEAEVRSDGSLDYDREFFENFDFVGASIHQAYRQSPEKLTERAVKALTHPAVDILFHPTNRLIQKRDPNPLDLPKVIATAKENGKMLEIDGSPQRLDLDEVWARTAAQEGVTLLIDSDAHSTGELENVEYGVMIARRAWIEKKNVANTLPLSSLLKRLA